MWNQKKKLLSIATDAIAVAAATIIIVSEAQSHAMPILSWLNSCFSLWWGEQPNKWTSTKHKITLFATSKEEIQWPGRAYVCIGRMHRTACHTMTQTHQPEENSFSILGILWLTEILCTIFELWQWNEIYCFVPNQTMNTRCCCSCCRRSRRHHHLCSCRCCFFLVRHKKFNVFFGNISLNFLIG